MPPNIQWAGAAISTSFQLNTPICRLGVCARKMICGAQIWKNDAQAIRDIEILPYIWWRGRGGSISTTFQLDTPIRRLRACARMMICGAQIWRNNAEAIRDIKILPYIRWRRVFLQPSNLTLQVVGLGVVHKRCTNNSCHENTPYIWWGWGLAISAAHKFRDSIS